MICATNEAAAHSLQLFQGFAMHFHPEIKLGMVHGGTPMPKDTEMMKDASPHILIGTPGRVLELLRNGVRGGN